MTQLDTLDIDLHEILFIPLLKTRLFSFYTSVTIEKRIKISRKLENFIRTKQRNSRKYIPQIIKNINVI